MQTIDTLVRSVQIIAVIIVVLLAIFGAVGFYFMKIHRSRVQEKHLDYSQFRRLDSLEYVRFDDVGEYMVVADGKKRFIGAIACSGCEFRDAEDEERLQIIRGYLSFINVLDNQNIQFWQMARDVNLDKMVTDYKEQLTSLQERQYLMTLDYEEIKKESEQVPEGEEERYDLYYQKLRQMQREIMSLGYRVDQLKIQVQYLESVSGEKADPHLDQLYIYDWTYNAIDFTQELTESEIYSKAEKQLENRAAAYISSLRNAGVKARMLTGVEILEQMRRYTHPVSAAKYRADEILQSAYDSIAVTSSSLREMEETVSQNALREMAAEFAFMEEEENL
ncbi:hypothetical protein [Candidatus Merdisoma sp. JLR.KK006]|jgi:hypothetical protein|uniref:hypothetical protein n=1 Tax=Candidatus Merdisoma sp. JLR.KK006 TaxID=3112626 RepID=UPI0026F0AF02|nr:hypothetical protein [Bacteroides intestinalis]